MKISDALLPEFDQEMATTRKCLARIPDGKFSYKPHPRSFEMGALAVHIATMLDWGVLTLQTDSFDYAPVGHDGRDVLFFRRRALEGDGADNVPGGGDLHRRRKAADHNKCR